MDIISSSNFKEVPFKILWSRFGNAKLEKWDKRSGGWALQ